MPRSGFALPVGCTPWRLLTLAWVVLGCPVDVTFAVSGQTGATAAETRFRLIRSVSGTRGHSDGGRFVIDDPRNSFRPPADTQVIVSFDWEGPAGEHQLEGLWKNPAGKVVTVSDFHFTARERRFGGYFTLLITDSIHPGLWSIDARVDGEPAGTHIFTIVIEGQPVPAGTPAPPPARQPLSPSTIYEKAKSATVLIKKIGREGDPVDSGSGFFLGNGLLLTAFQVIDGAVSLRVAAPDKTEAAIDQVLAYDRWQDWALLKTAPPGMPLQRAPTKNWSVGDRVYTMDISGEGNRVLVRADITGTNNFPQSGERINLLATSSQNVAGAPLLNEFGEVIGVMGGDLVPGISSLKVLPVGASVGYTLVRTQGALATPINLVPEDPGVTAKSLSDLMREGVFLPPLVKIHNILYAAMARRIDRSGAVPRAIEETNEFSSRDQKFGLLASWDAKEKFKGVATIRLYDLDNRRLMESKPSKLSLKPGGSIVYSMWELSAVMLKPGIYRLDLVLNDDPVWRTFFKIQ